MRRRLPPLFLVALVASSFLLFVVIVILFYRLLSSSTSVWTPFCRTQDEDEGGYTSPYQLTSDKRTHLRADDDAACLPVDCVINDDYEIGCCRLEFEVYLPFNFIAKYFEIEGTFASGDTGSETFFSIRTSSSRIYFPTDAYSPEGVYMSFEHYDVELRDHVKCISASDGVPISIQWSSDGYFYPTQIAQFGLSHYSKHLKTEKREPPVDLLRNEEHGWSKTDDVNDRFSAISESGGKSFEFQTKESLKYDGIFWNSDATLSSYSVLSMLFKFDNLNASIAVTIEVGGLVPRVYRIHYICSSVALAESGGTDIYYGMGDGPSNHWMSLTRDVRVDLEKGVLSDLGVEGQGRGSRYGRRRRRRGKGTQQGSATQSRVVFGRLVSVHLRGSGRLLKASLATEAHFDQFLRSADWFLRNQDPMGAWPVPVTRRLAAGRLLLRPGWYSAMGQGQAISVLVRAFKTTGNASYLRAALDATKVFDIPSHDGGVLAQFLDRYPWYEEYPTTPGTFVLNGFIYSLVGLYDLKGYAKGQARSRVEALYHEGMQSLRGLLGLFDTGSRTLYDLRHVGLAGLEPNRARWDYHATHINLLLLINNTDYDRGVETTLRRWIGYPKGVRVSQN